MDIIVSEDCTNSVQMNNKGVENFIVGSVSEAADFFLRALETIRGEVEDSQFMAGNQVNLTPCFEARLPFSTGVSAFAGPGSDLWAIHSPFSTVPMYKDPIAIMTSNNESRNSFFSQNIANDHRIRSAIVVFNTGLSFHTLGLASFGSKEYTQSNPLGKAGALYEMAIQLISSPTLHDDEISMPEEARATCDILLLAILNNLVQVASLAESIGDGSAMELASKKDLYVSPLIQAATGFLVTGRYENEDLRDLMVSMQETFLVNALSSSSRSHTSPAA